MSTVRHLIIVEELTWSDTLIESSLFTTTIPNFPIFEEVG
jgi:hypothetical protein